VSQRLQEEVGEAEEITIVKLNLKTINPQEGSSKMAEQYWKDVFANLETTHYPLLPSVGYQPILSRTIDYALDGLDWETKSDGEIDIATKLRAVWALLLAQYSNSEYVVFGTRYSTSNGLSSENQDAAPSLLPLKVQVAWQSRIASWLYDIQAREEESKKVQDWGGPERIRLCSPEAQEACNFPTLLSIGDSRNNKVC
jgi:hypothetical protein